MLTLSFLLKLLKIVVTNIWFSNPDIDLFLKKIKIYIKKIIFIPKKKDFIEIAKKLVVGPI
jgi:hypothetical protein